ncbi:hypothetical protein [Mycoplasmopsis synoviae]|uniref:Uncharacterized protein n=2 Tax=Mycoplasmopsis synoviae TaxID=2109 RepID=Q4A5K8_MYCS5|nr:hypothetical protein [Mycoplasmopsis synoviae]AAZ43963.2 hypothetical protein MS53_0555 [Mycoplasmopsis synoviae 53]
MVSRDMRIIPESLEILAVPQNSKQPASDFDKYAWKLKDQKDQWKYQTQNDWTYIDYNVGFKNSTVSSMSMWHKSYFGRNKFSSEANRWEVASWAESRKHLQEHNGLGLFFLNRMYNLNKAWQENVYKRWKAKDMLPTPKLSWRSKNRERYSKYTGVGNGDAWAAKAQQLNDFYYRSFNSVDLAGVGETLTLRLKQHTDRYKKEQGWKYVLRFKTEFSHKYYTEETARYYDKFKAGSSGQSFVALGYSTNDWNYQTKYQYKALFLQKADRTGNEKFDVNVKEMVDSKYKGFKLPKASFKLVNETLKALAAKDPYVPEMNKNNFNWDFTSQRGQKVYQTQALSARRAQSSNFNARFEMM